MRTKPLELAEVLDGYDAVGDLYPYIPPLSFWRAWECASYRRFTLEGRILDIGCGDGSYFRLIWPDAVDVVGVDHNPEIAEHGRNSGVYTRMHTAAAHRIPEPDACFDNAFANCSLEHMERLPEVLAEIRRCLRPGGKLLCSVVTNRFVEWSLLPQMVAEAGYAETAAKLQKDFLDFHHLVNPLTVQEWIAVFEGAGFVMKDHIPILPRCSSGIFLLMDSLWHVPSRTSGELGGLAHRFLSANPAFPGAFRQMIAGLLGMETDWNDCSGAVFCVQNPE